MLSEALNKKIVICLGSGGVGKTTTAAALGMQAAVAGKKVLVMTIDPARRLRSALGIPAIGNFESEVSPALFDEAGIHINGEFHAMMLDTKSAFDDVIRRIAPDEMTIRSIVENRIYHYVSTTLAGSREYVAAERLYDISKRGMYDLIIVDTPPTKNALDFLEAPSRMTKFLDDKVMRLFLVSISDEKGLKETLLRSASAVIFKLMGIVFGEDFTRELNDLILNFKDMYGEFHRRARELDVILHSDDVTFLVVTSPDRSRINESSFLARKLKSGGYHLGGIIVNRVNTAAGEDFEMTTDELQGRLLEAVPELDLGFAKNAAEMMMVRFGQLKEEARRDQEIVKALSEGIGHGTGFYVVPTFNSEVCDLKSLDGFRRSLFPEEKKQIPGE